MSEIGQEHTRRHSFFASKVSTVVTTDLIMRQQPTPNRVITENDSSIVATVARCSAGEIVWHRWEPGTTSKTLVANRGSSTPARPSRMRGTRCRYSVGGFLAPSPYQHYTAGPGIEVKRDSCCIVFPLLAKRKKNGDGSLSL